MYKNPSFKEFKRYVVFRVRCWSHRSSISQLLAFFDQSDFRKHLLQESPAFIEQATRSFFYLNSTWGERIDLIQKHIEILERIFKPAFLEKVYIDHQSVVLWQEEWRNKNLSLLLDYDPGQRKERCLSLRLQYGDETLYQIIFWISWDKDKNVPLIYVGALQGVKNGSEIIKDLTKAFFGYRTKNLIFYGLRCFAKSIGAKDILAVSNEGYYAMNHIRLDRKLKTSFSDFWQECEGKLCEDNRFYKIPTEETRKTMEEIKSSKRAQYRRRFQKLDEIDNSVKSALTHYLLEADSEEASSYFLALKIGLLTRGPGSFINTLMPFFLIFWELQLA